MASYLITARIETDDQDDLTMQDIRDALYHAGGDLPFTFTVITMKDEK